jgi:putative salt-induced outer membrane protein YdiY
VRTLILCIILATILACNWAYADQISLTNGDRLSGTILKSDEKSLILKTDYAGEVTIDWNVVQSVTSSEPLHIKLKSGETVVGPVTTTDGKLQVATKSQGSVEASKENISAIRGEAEQSLYDKSLHPGLLEGWAGGSNIGFALTRGNSQTKNLAIAFTAARTTLHDKLGLYATTVYATNDAPGATPTTTANTVQGGARYDHDLTPRLFAYGTIDFQTDSLQGLDLRTVPGAGLGVHLIKNEDTTFDLLAGINYTREKYTTFTRNFAAASFGDEFMHKLHGRTVLTQRFFFYPDLNDISEYRATFDFGTVTKINKWFGWQNSFGDIFVTNPPPTKRQNDIVFTTGLNLSFTH